MATPQTRARTAARHPRLLLFIPYLWLVAAIPLVNRVHATPLGVPLLLWWELAGVIVTTVCLGVVWRLDRNAKADRDGKVSRR